MVGVSCSCIPPPASIQARKLYNLLVPDVFSTLIPPKIDEPISTGLKRKFNKLQEYVCKNPSKAAKVSRRLTRRIKKALYDRQLGIVKVAVYAYINLLDKSTEEDSTYTFNYFSKELIHQPDTVIHTLLTYPSTEVQTLGAELLAAFLKAQSEVEHQAEASTSLVECVVKLPSAAKARSAGLTQRAPSAAAASGPGLGPEGELVVSCLVALREYVALCQKLKIMPTLLEQIEVLVLDSVESDPRGAAWLKAQAIAAAAGSTVDGASITEPAASGAVSPVAANSTGASAGPSVTGGVAAALTPTAGAQRLKPAASAGAADGLQLMSSASITLDASYGAPATGSRAGEVAVGVLRNFRPFLQDISSVRRVMETLLTWLDANGRWERRELVEGLLALVRRAAGGLTFPLTSALMRHADAPGLATKTRATVVRFAVEQGAVYPLSALSLALSELPAALAAVGAGAHSIGSAAPNGNGKDDDAVALTRAVHDAVAGLSRQVADAGQVAEALAVALKGHAAAAVAVPEGPAAVGAPSPSAVLLAALEVGVVALKELPSLGEGGRHFPGRTLPSSLLHGLTPLVLGAGPQLLSAPQAISTAARDLLAAAFPSIGGPLRDEKQAVHLAQLARALLVANGGTNGGAGSVPSPDVFAMAEQYLEVVVGCGKPGALLAAAHVTLEASGSVAETGGILGTGGMRVAGATMLLCCALAQRLAVAAQCPGLTQRCRECDGAAALAPELRLVEDGERGGVRLQASSASWAPTPHADTVVAGPKLAAAAAAWRAAFKAAVCDAGLLASEFGLSLPALLDQQLPPPTLPAAVGVALGSAGLLSPGSHHVRHGHSPSGVGGGDVATSPSTQAVASANGAPEPLQVRVAQQTWGARAATLRRERLNLVRVMELLGPGEGESSDVECGEGPDTPNGGGADAVAALLAGSGASMRGGVPGEGGRGDGSKVCANVEDVLAVLAAADAEGPGKMWHGGHAGPQVLQLAQELEPHV